MLQQKEKTSQKAKKEKENFLGIFSLKFSFKEFPLKTKGTFFRNRIQSSLFLLKTFF